MLREHKERLESRMKILEEHNQQLVSQLGKLKHYLGPSSDPTIAAGGTNGIIGGMSMHPGTGGSKTGTLNTKSVTASQLAQNSPLLPHKMNGQYINLESRGDNGQIGGGGKAPPALPPRGVLRPGGDGSLMTQGGMKMAPAVPPKRSSLTRSELALYSETVS
jgi:hypothetical protein